MGAIVEAEAVARRWVWRYISEGGRTLREQEVAAVCGACMTHSHNIGGSWPSGVPMRAPRPAPNMREVTAPANVDIWAGVHFEPL